MYWIDRTGAFLLHLKKAFVSHLVEHAHAAGQEAFEAVEVDLLNSAVSGVRTGAPGHPMLQDVAMRDQARAVLEANNLSDPAPEFYEFTARYAEGSIRRRLARDEELMT